MNEKKIEDAINKQVNEEFYSAYLYLAMAAWFEEQALHGMAHWMRKQFAEEQSHAAKFIHYLGERGWRTRLEAIAKPQEEWKGPKDAFEAALQHEKHITASIGELMELAVKEKDHATQVMLQWFVSEQVEEEGNVVAILEKLRMAGDNAGGLYFIDRELAAR